MKKIKHDFVIGTDRHLGGWDGLGSLDKGRFTQAGDIQVEM